MLPSIPSHPAQLSPFAATAILMLLIIVFIYISVDGVGAYHFSADEMMHLGMARGESLLEVLQFSMFEPHPPLGNMLRYYWLQLFDEPALIRSQSLLFGVLTILLSYRVGAHVGNPLTGLCVAVFTAFCPPLILQSYIVRNYAFFAFFVTLAFCAYLHWAHRRSSGRLICYGAASTIACLTNFSGMFAIASIGVFESIRWFQRRGSIHELSTWIMIHITIAIITVGTWWWLFPSGIDAFQQYVRAHADHGWRAALHYPNHMLLALLAYSPSGHGDYLLPCFVIIVFIMAGWHLKAFRAFAGLFALSTALGMMLIGFNIYSPSAPRHFLWSLPFLSLCCGWVAALLITYAQRVSVILGVLGVLVLIGIGIATYSGTKRFSQRFEYQITKSDWQTMTQILGALDSSHAIIARRADVLLMDPPHHNPYRYMQRQPSLMATAPYHNTKIIFNPVRSHPKHYASDIQLHMVGEAESQGWLDNVETLVFVATSWTARISSHMVHLALCETFPKTIQQIPLQHTSIELSANMYKVPVTLIYVPKKLFLEQLIYSNPNSTGCFQ